MNEFMDFSQALLALEEGSFVARKGWNGKGMFIYRVEASDPTYDQLRGRCKDAIDYAHATDNELHAANEVVHINTHIDMKAADGSIVVGWLASQTDMAATDWMVIKE